jgi:hypothetical protein
MASVDIDKIGPISNEWLKAHVVQVATTVMDYLRAGKALEADLYMESIRQVWKKEFEEPLASMLAVGVQTILDEMGTNHTLRFLTQPGLEAEEALPRLRRARWKWFAAGAAIVAVAWATVELIALDSRQPSRPSRSTLGR